MREKILTPQVSDVSDECSRTLWQEVVRRFRKNRLVVVALFVLLALLTISVGTIVVDHYTNNRFYKREVLRLDLRSKLEAPRFDEPKNWFGRDEFGRSVFYRVVWGARYSLFIGISTVAMATLFGGILGAISGYYGGKLDNIVMRVMDVLGAIPGTLLAISIAAVLGRGIVNLILALGISAVPLFARIVRANVLTVKSKDYVEAGKCVGASDARLILKHMIPNAMGPIIVQATFGVASNILMIAGLSYIGLGIAPPTPEWGGMLSEAKTNIQLFWHPMVFPGVAIFLTSFSLNVLGDGLRDAFDPKLR